MNRTQIQLTERQYRALKDLSVSSRKSVAELIREAVDAMLNETVHTSPDDRKRRALAATGLYRSGVSDLSAEHDAHLSRAFADDDLR